MRHAKTLRLVSFAIALLILLVTSAGTRAARAEDVPVVDTAIGRDVHAAVRVYYRALSEGRKDAPYPHRALLPWLSSADADLRKRGGAWMLAFFKQTLHDEEHGLAPKPDGYKLGGGPQDEAAALRWIAARDLAQARLAAGAQEALAPAIWLLEEDPPNALHGAETLVRIEGPEADDIIRGLLRAASKRNAILVVALKAAATRALRDVEPAARRLCTHYDEDIRESAGAYLAAWDLEEESPYTPEAGMRWLAGDLERLTSALLESPAPDASWCRVEVTEPPWREGGDPYVHEHHGWLTAKTDEEIRLIDWFGLPQHFETAKTKVCEEDLVERTRQIVKDRAAWLEASKERGFRGEHRDFPERMGALRFSRSGGVWEGSLPEALMAAWCLEAGETSAAADLLMPILEAWDDHAAFFDYAHEQLALRLDHQMLDAFVQGRYADALPLARHLRGDAFADFRHQDRAVGLATQLPRRIEEDFVTLALPTQAAWEALTDTLSREEQIRYLAARIRLIRAEQNDIPGSVSYGTEQWRPKDGVACDWTADREVLINPYNELWSMNLTANELPLLFDVVRGDDYIRAYDLPRFLPHWPINLHRARWVAGTLVQTVAQRDLLDPAILRSKDAKRIEAHLAEAKAWCEAEGGVTFGDRLERVVTEDADWERVKGAAYTLNHVDSAVLGRAAAKRLATDAEHRGDLMMVAAHTGTTGALAAARAAIESEDAETRGWAALLLVKCGDRAEREGIDALLSALAEKDLPALQNGAVDALLETGDEAATQGLLAFLGEKAPQPTTMLVVQRLFLAGHEQARDFVLRCLGDDPPKVYSQIPWMSGSFEEVRGPDRVAWQLGRWSSDVPLRGKQKPTEAEREVWRESVRTWVRQTFERIQAGEEPGIERVFVVEPFVSWSGQGRWIRRL